MGLKVMLVLLVLTLISVEFSGANYDNIPGVIELVGYSNRRARTYYAPADVNPSSDQPASKMQADIETVRQNIEKYNKLLTMDTKNLPDSQKDMLERIVERVARLKESLDINEQIKDNRNSTKSLEDKETEEVENSTLIPATSATGSEVTNMEDDNTEPTLVLDETTLLQLQTSMNKLAAAQAAVTSQTAQMREFPTTTEMMAETEMDREQEQEDEIEEEATNTQNSEEYEGTTFEPGTETTDPAEEFVAARSNNNLAGITAASDETDTMATLSTTIGSQRTLTTNGKLTKTRATKRPNHKGSNNSKRRPSTSTSAQSQGYNKVSTQKQKLTNPTGVTQPIQQYQKISQKPQQQQYQQPIVQTYQSQPPKAIAPSSISLDKLNSATAAYGINPVNNIAIAVASTTSLPVNTYGSSAASAAANGHDIAYDSHVNTSAIIDSLNAREEYYQQKQSAATGVVNKDKKPITGAKPTKYHYYPHNQHIYLLPECAIQQVCNAVYVRLNYTQPLCACPSRYRDPCSASLNEDDQHTTKLIGDGKKKAITLAKTCEATTEMRECRSPKDWSLLALQNTRTGKSHYLVICRCPDHFKMEGPMAHDQPTYASVPGIRVFGMMCVKPGYSVRKPSVQPPKRYQLQKPFYRPGSQTSFGQSNGNIGSTSANNQYGGGNNKNVYDRPTYGGGSSSGLSSSAQSSSTSSSSFNANNNNNYNNHGSDSYQSQGNYQYLNRPESISTSSFNNNNNNNKNNNNFRPEPVSINNFPGGGYGRNNEREGEAPIEAATEVDNKLSINTSTPAAEEARTTLSEETTKSEELKRDKRSLSENTIDLEEESPEFPWDRVIEFEKTIVWD